MINITNQSSLLRVIIIRLYVSFFPHFFLSVTFSYAFHFQSIVFDPLNEEILYCSDEYGNSINQIDISKGESKKFLDIPSHLQQRDFGVRTTGIAVDPNGLENFSLFVSLN